MGYRPTGLQGGGPRVVVSTAAFHARVRGSVPGLGGLKETKLFLPHPRVKVNIVGSLRDREVACSASDRQGSNFESCVWRTVSSQSSHHPQEVLLAQFSLYVHKGGLKPDLFHFIQAYMMEGNPFDEISGDFIITSRIVIENKGWMKYEWMRERERERDESLKKQLIKLKVIVCIWSMTHAIHDTEKSS